MILPDIIRILLLNCRTSDPLFIFTSSKCIIHIFCILLCNITFFKVVLRVKYHNTNRDRGVEYYPNYNVEYYTKGITRNVYLSVTYKFGNNDVKGATKQVKFEESNRAGGNGGN